MKLRLPRVTADVSYLRTSRDLRLLILGNFVSGMGTQAALVALPYQVYLQTRSALLTGLIGAAELLPLIAMALLGAALPGRAPPRRLLLPARVALVAVAAGRCPAARAGPPPVALLYVLAGALA